MLVSLWVHSLDTEYIIISDMTHKCVSEHTHPTRQHTIERTQAGPVNDTLPNRTCADPAHLGKHVTNEPKMTGWVHETSTRGPKQQQKCAIATHDTRSKKAPSKALGGKKDVLEAELVAKLLSKMMSVFGTCGGGGGEG